MRNFGHSRDTHLRSKNLHIFPNFIRFENPKLIDLGDSGSLVASSSRLELLCKTGRYFADSQESVAGLSRDLTAQHILRYLYVA